MAEKERMTDFRPEDRPLLAAAALASAAWIVHLNVSYILVPESCADRSKLMLHAITLVCLAMTAVAGMLAWRQRHRVLPIPAQQERYRWMSTAAAVYSAALALVIVAQEIPNLMLRSCE